MARDIRTGGESLHRAGPDPEKGQHRPEAKRRGVEPEKASPASRRAVRDTSTVDHEPGRKTSESDKRLSALEKQKQEAGLLAPRAADGVGLRRPHAGKRRGRRQEPEERRSAAPAPVPGAEAAVAAPKGAAKDRLADAVRARLAELVQPGLPAGLLATRTVGAHIADALLRGPDLAAAMRELASSDELSDLIAGAVSEHRQGALAVARGWRDDARILGRDTPAHVVRVDALEELSPRVAAVTAVGAIVRNLRQALQLQVARSLESLSARVTERLERLAHPPVAAAVAAAVLAAPDAAANELAAMGLVDVDLESLLAPAGGERVPEIAERLVAEARGRLQAFREVRVGIQSIACDFTLLSAEVRHLVLVPELVAMGLDPAGFPYHQPRSIIEEVVRDGQRSTGLAVLAGHIAEAVAGPNAIVAKLLGVAARTVRVTELNRDLARIGIGTIPGARLAGLEQGARGLMQLAVDAVVTEVGVRGLVAGGRGALGHAAPGLVAAVRRRDAGDLIEDLARFAIESVAREVRSDVLPEAMLLDQAAAATATRLAGRLLGAEGEAAARDRARAIVYARTAFGRSLIGADERRRMRVALARIAPPAERARVDVALPVVEAMLATAFGPETAEVVRGDDFERVLRELLLEPPVPGV